MSAILFVTACILIALGLTMQANRAGYVYFVVGPRTVLAFAAAIGTLGLWFLTAAR